MTGKPQIDRNLAGQRFGRLTAISFQRRKYERMWDCSCQCGTQHFIARERNLLIGRSTSCGCWFKERAQENRVKHGLFNHPLYRVWQGMMKRCYSPKANNYANYGGRGVIVCERWHSLANFVADVGEKPTGLSIDRIDNDKGYEPGNIRWATRTEQSRNRSVTVWVDWQGERRRLADLADEAGLAVERTYSRFRIGWPLERIFGSHPK